LIPICPDDDDDDDDDDDHDDDDDDDDDLIVILTHLFSCHMTREASLATACLLTSGFSRLQTAVPEKFEVGPVSAIMCNSIIQKTVFLKGHSHEDFADFWSKLC